MTTVSHTPQLLEDLGTSEQLDYCGLAQKMAGYGDEHVIMDTIDKDVVEESTVRHTSFTDGKSTSLTFLVRPSTRALLIGPFYPLLDLKWIVTLYVRTYVRT